MQVEVTANGLERRLTVRVPAERYDQEIENRLKSLGRSARVDGFRVGKVPYKVVENRWGSSVRQEVRDELVQSSYREAIGREKLHPAGMPHFELYPDEPGSGLRYTATFEVYPEFDLRIPENLKLEKPVAEITEADIGAMIETLRKQRRKWEPVTRPAQIGDRVVLDFKGSLNGEEFPGNAANHYTVVLGDGVMLASFEENLAGLKADQESGFDVEFPKNYQVQALTGKRVHFDVKIHDVAEAKLPEVDDTFMASFGVTAGGIQAFREEVKANMRRELEQAIKGKVKRQVMESLIAANPIQLPKALVDDEMVRVKEQIRDAGDTDLASIEQGKTFEEQARRRVALGLIIAEIVKKNQFKATPDKVRAAVDAVAVTYEHPEEVVKWYYARRERLGNVEALVLEDQAVEWLVQQATVTEKPATFHDLIHGAREKV